MKKILQGPFLYIIIVIAVIAISTMLSNMNSKVKTEVEYREFLNMVKDEQVESVAAVGNNIYILKKDSKFKEEFPTKYDHNAYTYSVESLERDVLLTLKSEDQNVDLMTLRDIDLDFRIMARPEEPWIVVFLPYLVMLAIFGAFWFMLMRQNQGGGKVMQFGKSRARMSSGGDTKVTFDDVAGADEEKQELQEVVDFLKDPKKYIELGARIPKGMLLVGPPGTGKTLLAKASAGEAGVPFFSISGSDFVEMFVGVGASRVRDLFEQAKKQSPCIIFIDEIDAVGRKRGAGLGGGHDEREQTLNQLLVEMDGFNVNEGIIILAATNRADILDPALLRPGRFDRQIVVNYPDVKGREEILKIHAKNKPLAQDVDLKTVARSTSRFTGADLENLLNEAAILAARYNQKEITNQNIQDSIMRVLAGTEKKNNVITDEDKKITAYHEAGHAIASHVLPHTDPVREVSIIPRGMAAGYTMTLPDDDRTHVMKSKLLDDVTMTLSGRAAEEIVFGDISTGAYNDLKVANQTVRSMITQYGMSDELGLLFYGGNDHEVFLGMDYGQKNEYSEEMAAKIDVAAKKIIDRSYDEAKRILEENRERMDRIVETLLEKEKIDRNEFESFFDDKKKDDHIDSSNTPLTDGSTI